ncbi:MAG: type II toxin-antitoxin system prevent-host-death family antitoxin [Gaiellaceae bacterium]
MVVRVGVRDLRENLRSWLDRVKDGDEIVVTERGKAVAQLTPLDPPRSKLEELIEAGIVRPPLKPKRTRIDTSKLPRMTPGPTLSDIVIEQRRSSRY